MFVYNREVQKVPAGEGISRKVLAYSDEVMLCEITLKQGAVVEPHAHPHQQITYIISGKCSYCIAGEEKNVGAGDSVLIPGNTLHSVRVFEDMLVVDVFSPAREDFIAPKQGE